jgi:hypothetical protein
MFMMHAIPFAEAKATIERDKAEVAARGALVPDAIKASIDFDLGNVHLLWGDIKSADPLIASSASTLRPRTEAPGERFDLAVYQGLAAMYAGRHQEADTYLRERLALRNLMGGGRSPFATYDYVYIAQNLCMQGQCTQARAFLDSAPAFDDLKGRPSNSGSYSLVIRRALARIDLELGDSASARELLPGEDGNGNDTLLLRGEILCAQGYRSDGLALLETYLQDEQRIAYEHAPDLARARAVAGQCALANGQRKRATELADLARASFAAQPNVSPYFKRALEQLDRRLGTRSVER